MYIQRTILTGQLCHSLAQFYLCGRTLYSRLSRLLYNAQYKSKFFLTPFEHTNTKGVKGRAKEVYIRVKSYFLQGNHFIIFLISCFIYHPVCPLANFLNSFIVINVHPGNFELLGFLHGFEIYKYNIPSAIHRQVRSKVTTECTLSLK